MSLYDLVNKLALSRLAVGNLSVNRADVVRPERLKDRVFANINNATPVMIHDVAERFSAQETQEGWNFTRDFGEVAPPSDLFFLEGGRPTRVVSETGDMDPELVPRRWGVLFEVVNENTGWDRAELDLLMGAMNFQRAQTALIYVVNFVSDEEGVDFIRPEGEERLYHRLKDSVYLWAQTWFFPLDRRKRIIRHPHYLYSPAYRNVRREVLNVLTERLNLMCIPALYALGRLSAGAASLERADGKNDRYRLADLGGTKRSSPPVSVSGTGAAENYKRFRDALEACERRVGGGKIGLDMVCVYDVIERDPDGAQAYVEFYCLAAGEDKRYMKLAAVVAKGYESVFHERTLNRRVYTRAREIGAMDVIEPIMGAGGDDEETGRVN